MKTTLECVACGKAPLRPYQQGHVDLRPGKGCTARGLGTFALASWHEECLDNVGHWVQPCQKNRGFTFVSEEGDDSCAAATATPPSASPRKRRRASPGSKRRR